MNHMLSGENKIDSVKNEELLEPSTLSLHPRLEFQLSVHY